MIISEIRGPDDTGSERVPHVPGALVMEWVLRAGHRRRNAAGQFSRRHHDPTDDVLSCFDRLLRTAREPCRKNTISQLCGTESRNRFMRLVSSENDGDHRPATLRGERLGNEDVNEEGA